MNSQERVLAALNLEEPDRVPVGEIDTISTAYLQLSGFPQVKRESIGGEISGKR